MTVISLLEGLAAEISAAVKDYKLAAQDQPNKPVSIYIQHVPAQAFERDSFYPLVIVEYLGHEENVEESTASILLTIGTYDGVDRQDWWREHLNLVNRIKEHLLTHIVIGERHILKMPIAVGLAEKQRPSFSFSSIFLEYRTPSAEKSYVR